MSTVLVVGGTGVFGSRLVERLARSSDCTILVAGRSAPCALDREHVTPADLRALGATIVVDAAGPFQGQAPQLARAAIAAGCHFIDLADARDYVAAFPSLNDAALAADVLATCGASSTPSLSNAVLDDLAGEMVVLESAEIAISPGNRAPRGLSVVRAILSYVGRPVRVHEGGRSRMRPGWSLLHRRALTGIGARWFSLCETPDLDLVAARFPEARTVRFYAGLELAILHCGLWVLSLLVRARLLRSLAPYASQLLAIARRLERFGTDRGGMLVEAAGWDREGRRVTATWELIAASGVGPYVPTAAALAMIRKLLSNSEPRRGAFACVGLLSLDEIMRELAGLDIRTHRQVTRTEPLFRRALGGAFDRMPTAIRDLHKPRAVSAFKGVATVEAAANPLAALLARAFRFPPPRPNAAAEVTIESRGACERWRRRFDTSAFASVLKRRSDTGQLTERFGLLVCTLHIDAHERGLDMRILAATFAGLPLPRWFVPWTRAHERVDEAGRFTFDVEIGLPGVGRLVRYRGWLVADDAAARG